MTKKWLKVLNDHWLGKGNKYLVGDQLTIADIFGARAPHLRPCHPHEFKDYPNIEALAEADRDAAELAEDQRSARRLPQRRQGSELRRPSERTS